MYKRNERETQNFINNLTGADSVETEGHLGEITSNHVFRKSLEENQDTHDRAQFSGFGWDIGTTLGMVLYTLCRIIKPDSIVETGVASGVSSSYILCALEENKHGMLYSIDLAWQNKQSGWIIPQYLRHRWQLMPGRSSDELPPLLDKLDRIDVFLHDSEHTYRSMLFEYQTAWAHLRAGGLLLSHNIDANDAFADFSRSVKLKKNMLGILGGLVKI